MGLFDFVKESGRKLFSNETHAEREIEKHIQENNPGVKDLKAKFKNAIVYLSGEAQSAEAVQKAVLLAGNVQGVQSVNVDGVKVPATFQTPTSVESYQGTQYYVIQAGDTLSKIAKRFYGDPMKYTALFEANREVIQNPDLIYPGQKIRIPGDSESRKYSAKAS